MRGSRRMHLWETSIMMISKYLNGVLVNPVGVEHTKVAGLASGTLFRNVTEGAASLQVVDTGVAGLTVHLTLVDRALAATTADTHAVDAVTLLGLVAETTGLVGASGPSCPMDGGQLTELPGADTLAEAHHVGLLAVPHLTKVLVGSHGLCCSEEIPGTPC